MNNLNENIAKQNTDMHSSEMNNEKCFLSVLNNLIESLLEAVIVIDENGVIVEFNKLADTLVRDILNKRLERGKLKKDYLGEMITDFNRAVKLALNGSPTNVVRSLQDYNGLNHWVEVKLTKMQNPAGKIGLLMLSLVDITELYIFNRDLRKEKENLVEKNQKIKLAFETADLAAWEIDLTEGIISIDKDWVSKNKVKITDGKIKFEDAFTIMHPNDVASLKANINELMRRGGDFKTVNEYRLARTDKDYLWVRSIAKLVYKDNKPVMIRGVSQNITKQKLANYRLQRNETLFRSIWERSNDGMRLLDEFGRIVYVNKAFCDIVGLEKKELEGFLFTKIYNMQEQVEKLKSFRERMKAGNIPKNLSRWMNLWNNTQRWFEVTNATISLEDEDNYTLSIFRDATENKLREQQLLELSSAVEQSPVSVIVTDISGKIRYVNKNFIEVTGYSVNEILNEQPNILRPEYHSRKDFNKLVGNLKDGTPWVGEVYNVDKYGNRYWEEAAIFPLRNKEGNINRYVVLGQDVSEKKQIEEENIKYVKQLEEFNTQIEDTARELNRVNAKLTKSEQDLKELNDSKDVFFSIIAHDLKGPFSAILGYSDFLKNDFDELTPEEAKDFASNIHLVAENVFALLENLLDWSRLQSGRMPVKFERVNILDIVNSSIFLYREKAKEKNISLVNDLEVPLYFHADGNMITTVVRNIISNAVKFTPEGGSITVSGYAEGDDGIITIKDTGVGMTQEFADKIFKIESNSTTLGTGKEKGTGLGLVLCYDLLAKMDGKIWVDTVLGEGTKFFIKLKLSEK